MPLASLFLIFSPFGLHFLYLLVVPFLRGTPDTDTFMFHVLESLSLVGIQFLCSTEVWETKTKTKSRKEWWLAWLSSDFNPKQWTESGGPFIPTMELSCCGERLPIEGDYFSQTKGTVLSRQTEDVHNRLPNLVSAFNGIVFKKCLPMKCDMW